MRTLDTDVYGGAAVEAVLRGQHAAYSCRFDILDTTLTRIGGLDGVTSATVDWNVDRAGKGLLKLELDATADLDSVTERLIKPWFRVLMPDGGFAEYPCGVYVWFPGQPARTLGAGPPDEWAVDLTDLLLWLDDGGPGLTGFTLDAGTVITTGIAQALARAGLTDTSGIVPSSAALAGPLAWGITDQQGQPVTWRTILTQLHTSLGYYSPWFDLDGVYQAGPQPDLRTATTAATYGTASDGVTIVPAKTGSQPQRRANRVFAKGATATGTIAYGTADADELYPTHPWRQGALRRYIDIVIDSSASDPATLDAAAAAELGTRLSTYQTLAFDAHAWPVHEAFDVLGFRWDADAEFDIEQALHERAWTLDLFTGKHHHECRRIVGVS